MKTLFPIFILIFFISSCKKDEFEIDNLNGNQISVIGHGGMGIGHTYPLNSLESILNCLNLGANGVEIDVQMTKDGVLVAFHDETLDQTTNQTGEIYNKTWDELESARYSYAQYGGYKVVKLADILKNIPNRKRYTYFLDCKAFNPNKDSAYLSALTNAITNMIDKYSLVENTYVEYKSEKFIQLHKTNRPDIKQFVYQDFDTAINLAKKYSLQGVVISIEILTDEMINIAHENGFMVATFNTHSHKRNTKAVELNVDLVQTDRVKHLIKILK